MNLAIKRNDGKIPDPKIVTGDVKFMTRAIQYTPDPSYVLVPKDMLEDFIDALCDSDISACDTETSGLNWQNSSVIGISFAVKDNPKMDKLFPGAKAFYYNIPEDFHLFKRYFQNGKDKIFHNAKFDLHMLMNHDLVTNEDLLKTRIADTMLMSYLNNENEHHGLKPLSKKYLDPNADVLEKLLKEFMKANNCSSYAEVPLDLLTDYAAADTYYTLELYYFLLPKLDEQDMLIPIATLFDRDGSLLEIEESLMKELLFQERLGVQLDIPFIEDYVKELEVELPKLEQQILDLAGAINVRSTDELYTKLVQLGVHPTKFDLTPKDKKPKVDVTALELFTDLYKENEPLVEFITAVRSLKDSEKQLETYLKNFLVMVDKEGRLHTQFNQHVARTGRLSSSEPNVQNIPKVYKKLRACFSVMPGWNIAFFDYSQVEMRLFADYSKDATMIAAINAGRDLHGETAREIMNIPVEKWDKMEEEETPQYKDLRQKGKTVNFGVVYGMGKKKTSDKLGLTKMEPIFEKKKNPETDKWEQVQIGEEPDYRDGLRFLNSYYDKFVGVQTLMNQTKQVIGARGFIRNRFNRRRRLEKQDSYKAVNALIQGAAADMIKVAMISVSQYLRVEKLKSRVVNNIHDEIWVEIPDDELYIIPKIKRILETWEFPKFKVPIVCDVDISNTNWREKHHLSKDSRIEVQELGKQIAEGRY